MEPIRALKSKVATLQSRVRELQLAGSDLDAELRLLRPPMDFSNLEWRESIPANSERVWKEECALSFGTPLSPGGLFLNLKSLTAYSLKYVEQDWLKANKRSVYLRQQWEWIPDEMGAQDQKSEEPAVKKLAIGMEGGFQLETEKGHLKKTYSIACGPKFTEDYPIESAPPALRSLIDAIIKREDASRQLDVQAWEASNDLFESKYARDLVQLDNGVKIASDPKTWKCAESGMTENLWLNLSTGYIGSGRANWDGTGGTGAALRHYQETGGKYPLVVKLGTITPDGKADVYSYAPDEDSLVIDPLLAQHLSHFGIRVGDLRKTEKTIAEMEVDLNVKYDWSRISEEGKVLEKVAGPRSVGLINLGNSCYCNSVYQSMFGSEQFSRAVLDLQNRVPLPDRPQFDLLQQCVKLFRAMQDPQANVRPLSNKPFEGSDYVSPRMLKTLFGENHRDFSTNEQQDAAEYVRHVLDRLNRAFRQNPSAGEDLSQWFNFELEERIECLQSHQVQYKRAQTNLLQLTVPYSPPPIRAGEDKHRDVVPFMDCVSATLGIPEVLDDYFSNATGRRGQARWEGIKLECEIPAVLDVDFGIEPFKGTGLRSNEVLLPSEPPANAPPAFTPSQQIIDAITEQGFSRNAAIRAAKATNNNLEAAVDWVMNHLDSTDLNDPLPEESSASSSAAFVPDAQLVEMIEGMGFSKNGAIRAAKATANSSEAAVNWVMEHMSDADFNEPLPPSPKAGGSSGSTTASAGASASVQADEESVGMLMSMGFDSELCAFALTKCGNNLERAADYLFSRTKEEVLDEIAKEAGAGSETTSANATTAGSTGSNTNTSTKYHLRAVISHVGKSTMSGHYVAHVNQSPPGQPPRWVFFNDEKAVLANDPPLDLGYLFLYEQV